MECVCEDCGKNLKLWRVLERRKKGRRLLCAGCVVKILKRKQIT